MTDPNTYLQLRRGEPCYFGHVVAGHAVYCHNDKWPDAPRKCRRGDHCAWIYGIDPAENKHENCPGFVANKAYKVPALITGD